MDVLRSRIAALLDRFLRDRRGVVAIIFGLSLLPLVLAVGVSVDYGRAGATKNRLQGAADTAALALAHEAGKLNQDELVAAARRIIEANFGSVQGATVAAVNVIEGDGEVTVTATADVPTTFAAVMRLENIPVSVSADAVWGGNPIELALVLDNTGSMVQDEDGTPNQKLATLKTAVHEMLSTLDDPVAVAEDAVHVAIVPFATQVRIPTSYENASWLLDYKEQFGLWAFLYGKWEGCVDRRKQPYDASDAAATTNDSRYRAASCPKSELQGVLPLTDDFEALGDKVDALQGHGGTNVTIGLAWGMAALSSQEPLTEASRPGQVEGLKKIMVVLTDGENTNAHTEDPRTEAACEAAKEMNIEIFTVRVIDGNEDLLEKCATDSAHYFNVENVSDLLPAFEAITTKISQLRLAK